MKQNIIHIGLDVDNTQYHGSAFNKKTGEVIDFKNRPTLKGLLQQLDRMARHFEGYKIKLCYEASYIGYCLRRGKVYFFQAIKNGLRPEKNPEQFAQLLQRAIDTQETSVPEYYAARYLISQMESH